MDKGHHTNKTILSNYKPPFTIDWSPFTRPALDRAGRHHGAAATLQGAGAEGLPRCPAGFKLHPRVEKVIADRRAMAEGKLPLDWGMGETLAYATLLDDGYGVRLSGEDVGRGTFSHRHAVLHDQNREKWDSGTYVPLAARQGGPADVRGHRLGADRRTAVLGFEYGYATSDPTAARRSGRRSSATSPTARRW